MKNTKGQKGFSLIELLIVVAIIGIIAAIAIPNLLASRRAANESAAIGTLRTMSSAQATFHSGSGGNYAAGTGLVTNGLLDNTFNVASATAVAKSGYNFTLTLDNPTTTFEIAASPVTPGSTGNRHFWTSESGSILQDDAALTRATSNNGTPIQ